MRMSWKSGESIRREADADRSAELQTAGEIGSELIQWPVQIKLAPVRAPYFDGAKLLIAADCSAYAYGDFHRKFIRSHVTLIGCPKLDDVDYSEKLTEIIKNNDIKSVTITRMEVPCCGGIEMAAKKALQNSGKFIPWQVVTFLRTEDPGITVKFCDCLHLQEIFQKKEREDENMSETSVNQRKVAMIGCGFVGSATAFALMESGLFSEMVLIDADKNRAEGEALDISHGLPFARPMKIYAGDYDDIVDAAIIIVTAGANQKPDETRLDLVQKMLVFSNPSFRKLQKETAEESC